jgi:hypothetical protein
MLNPTIHSENLTHNYTTQNKTTVNHKTTQADKVTYQ